MIGYPEILQAWLFCCCYTTVCLVSRVIAAICCIYG